MKTFEDSLRIFDTGNAASLAGQLFRESFAADFPVPRDNCGLSIPTPPENWRQYVAIYRWPDGHDETVGFCNWIKCGDVYLQGGMCVQKSFYRRMPRDHFRVCQEQGGVAQMMMAKAELDLTDCIAWFGYCGDAKAMAVDLRAGYVRTGYPLIIVKWFREVSEAQQQSLIDSIARLGPF